MLSPHVAIPRPLTTVGTSLISLASTLPSRWLQSALPVFRLCMQPCTAAFHSCTLLTSQASHFSFRSFGLERMSHSTLLSTLATVDAGVCVCVFKYVNEVPTVSPVIYMIISLSYIIFLPWDQIEVPHMDEMVANIIW